MIDGGVRVDLARVKARKDTVVQASRNGVTDWLKTMPGLSIYAGHGRLEGPDRVRVNGELLQAERIFINTGARPVVPDLPGLDQVEHLTSTGMLDLDRVPEHLVVVVANLLDDDPRRVSDRIPAYALYIDPPLGRAGLTEQQARETGRPVLMGKLMMTRVGRARERGETQGFMKVLIDAETQRILGAAVLGIGGDEIIHTFLAVMSADAPYRVLQRAVPIHPTVSELIPTLLGHLVALE